MFSFVGWISTFVAYICFLSWALLPEEVLHSVGITYYPSRYYATAIPSYLIVVYVLSGFAYMGWNMMRTLDPEDLGTVYDNRSYVSNSNSSPGRASLNFIKCGEKEGIPDIGDIDPLEISRLLCKVDRKRG